VGAKLQAAEDDEPRADTPLLLPQARVSVNYLSVLGTPVIAGRDFNGIDSRESNVAIVDRSLARFLWKRENPIGRRFRVGDDGEWLTVVGIIDDIMFGAPDGSIGEMAILRPAGEEWTGSYFAIRTSGDPGSVLPAVRDAVRRVDPDQPVSKLSTADDALAAAVDKQRFTLIVLDALAAVALGLTVVGVYGVLSFTVARRTREMGIRIALGARSAQVLGMLLRDGILLVAAGAALGLGGALLLAPLIRGLLYDIQPTNAVTLLAVTLMMLAVGAAACVLPARRATKVDPVEVLKAE
jgi:putative ABC transport system permease protein